MPAKLLMVGDGPERSATEELARELGVMEDIRFVGKQEQIEEILVVSDLFLLPSEYESFGLAALEAMAARNVVISTNAGGLPEINVQGKTGFMANVGDVATMSDFAVSILKNEVRLAEMKEAAYQHAKEFDIKNIIPHYEAIYKRFCRLDPCM
jgi:N-acetyl-alpha-D-glucosaminyl L-malate synthase BshA